MWAVSFRTLTGCDSKPPRTKSRRLGDIQHQKQSNIPTPWKSPSGGTGSWLRLWWIASANPPYNLSAVQPLGTSKI